MKKNGILTLLFALIPGAGEMYQGYMKRGLSLITMFCLPAALGAMTQIEVLYIGLPIVYMYSFFDTFNLRAQIGMGTAPEDDYLVHFDPHDKRLAQLLADSHKLLGWALIAFGALVGYQNILMNTLGDLLWRWGKTSPVFRALYLVMDQLPEVVVCVALIVCGIWLVKGSVPFGLCRITMKDFIRTAQTPPPADAAEEEVTEYQPQEHKKVNVQAILNSIGHRDAEADGEPEDTKEDDDGAEQN